MKINEMFSVGSVSQKANPSTLLVDTTMVGIENELEGMPPRKVKSVDGWRHEGDGSLRDNGIEYVLDGPKGGEDAEAAIIAFSKFAAEVKPTINERTSTHLHIDFRDDHVKDVGRFLSMYAVLEDTLFQLCDESRINNPYCVPMCSSSVMMNAMSRMLSGSWPESEAFSERMRYGAMNLASLPRYGSLEVRMRETIVDADEVFFWVNIFLSIKQFIRQWDDLTPARILEMISSVGVDSVFSMVLGDRVWPEMKARVPDYEDRILRSAQDVQAFFHDWTSAVVRKPFYLEDNILIRRARKTGRIRELQRYAVSNGITELISRIQQEFGLASVSDSARIAWEQDEPMFRISEAGATFFNTSVSTRFPLSAGMLLSRTQAASKGAVLARRSVVERVGRAIDVSALMDEESTRLYNALMNNVDTVPVAPRPIQSSYAVNPFIFQE